MIGCCALQRSELQSKPMDVCASERRGWDDHRIVHPAGLGEIKVGPRRAGDEINVW